MSDYKPLLSAAEADLGGYLKGSDVALYLKDVGRETRFTFTSLAEAPFWVDRNWAGFDPATNTPTLAVPRDFFDGATPFTLTVRIGDTLVYSPPQPGSGDFFGSFSIVPAKPPELGGNGPPGPVREAGASLEDRLVTGHVRYDELDADARFQLGERLARRFGPLRGEMWLRQFKSPPA
jgi:hypothetical protein